jgi:hypothetical protein
MGQYLQLEVNKMALAFKFKSFFTGAIDQSFCGRRHDRARLLASPGSVFHLCLKEVLISPATVDKIIV